MTYLREKLTEIKTKLQHFITRFPVSFLFLLAISTVGIYQIISEEDAGNLTVALTVSGLLAFLLEIAKEYGLYKKKYVPVAISCLFTVFLFLLLKAYENVYVYTAAAGISIAFIALIAAVLYNERKNEKLFSYLMKTSFITGLFSSVIMSGFSVCIAAFHFLIMTLDDVWKIYSIFGILVMGLFNFALFLSYVPEKDQDIEVPQIYRTIFHKALFYIYLLLIAILYMYIIKIVVTWKMPVGRLNWFGCFSLLFYVLFFLSVDETDGKVQKMFKTSGAYLLLPVLAIQLYAIYIRLSAYGLTTARLMSLILIAIAVGFMLSSMTKMPLTRPFMFTALTAILFTCTNINIYDLPNRIQEERLKLALIRGGALTNDKLDSRVQLEPEYAEEAKSAWDYLKYSEGTKSDFLNEFAQSKLAESFGDYYYDDSNIERINYYPSNDKWVLDVKDFSTVRYITSDTYNKDDVKINTYLMSLKQNNLDQEDAPLPYIKLPNDNIIVFMNITCEYDKETKEIDYLYWTAYLLEK